MIKPLGSLLVVGIVVALFSQPVSAQDAPPPPPPMVMPSPMIAPPYPYQGPFDPETFRSQLGLNDEQVEKMRKLRSDYLKELIRRRAAIKVAELDLAEAIEAKALDMAQVEKKVKELEATRSSLLLFRVKTLQETRVFLNDEQYTRLRQMIVRLVGLGVPTPF